MSALPAAPPARRLRVAVVAPDRATVRRLSELVALSGHDAVAPHEPADAVLTIGPAMAAPAGVPVVVLGEAFGEPAAILPETAGAVELDAALRAVAAGLVVRMPLPAAPGFAALPDDPRPALTPREIEVLAALAAGLGNKAVARRLGISPHTVKFHIEQLFRKLGAATRAEAVAKGLRRQIVEF
jgi:DNA-binding CsgD family transcriptional regulator